MRKSFRTQGFLRASILTASVAGLIHTAHGAIVSETKTIKNIGATNANGMKGNQYYPEPDNANKVASPFTSGRLQDLNKNDVFKKAAIANANSFTWTPASPNYAAPNIIIKGEKAFIGYSYTKGFLSIPTVNLTWTPPPPDFSDKVEFDLPTLQAVADADFEWDGVAHSLHLTITNYSGGMTRLDGISVSYNNSVGDMQDPLSWQVTGTQLFGIPSGLDLNAGELFSYTWTNLVDFDITKVLSIQSSETIDGEAGLDHLQAVLIPTPGILPMAWLGCLFGGRRR